MEREYIVTKSNTLITSNYDLSVQEQKIILTLASMVQPNDTEFKEYEFKIKDFMKLLDIKDQSKYKEIPKITKDLMKKVFEIKQGKDVLQLAWLSSVRYKTGEGIVILKFDSNLKPYMLELKELYTSYKLGNILELKSKYSIRLYEILKSNLFKKKVTIELEDLKQMTGAREKAYTTYANFKVKIILQAQKELKEKTDVSFEFEEIKTGRKITSIEFTIRGEGKNKEKIKDQIAIDKELEDTVQKVEMKCEGLVEQVQAIFEEELTTLEAEKLLKVSDKRVEIIKEKYEIAKQSSRIKNIVAWMIRAIREGYKKPKEKAKVDSFNDFEQRSYDYTDLEKKLLGWNNPEENEKDA